MVKRHALPDIWLVSDARNDARLERVLKRLPRGSGLVFRHYHLDAKERRTRFARLARIARARGHLVALAGSARLARRWRADAVYCAPALRLAGKPAAQGKLPCGQTRSAQGRILRLVTAHSLREVAMARRARADAILLSPVFATRSHPGARTLGPVRFRLLACHAKAPVIALGGMNAARARSLRWRKWAAIDGI